MLLRQSEYLVALAQERHFARAAAACRMPGSRWSRCRPREITRRLAEFEPDITMTYVDGR